MEIIPIAAKKVDELTVSKLGTSKNRQLEWINQFVTKIFFICLTKVTKRSVLSKLFLSIDPLCPGVTKMLAPLKLGDVI